MVGNTSSFSSHCPKKTTVNKITISAIISISLSAPQESATRLVSFAPKYDLLCAFSFFCCCFVLFVCLLFHCH